MAKSLLRDDGFIFISIDDNEFHNLRQVCDEIFGQDQFVGAISIENNPKGRKTIHMSPCNVKKMRKKKQMGENYFTEGRKKGRNDYTKIT